MVQPTVALTADFHRLDAPGHNIQTYQFSTKSIEIKLGKGKEVLVCVRGYPNRIHLMCFLVATLHFY